MYHKLFLELVVIIVVIGAMGFLGLSFYKVIEIASEDKQQLYTMIMAALTSGLAIYGE